MWIVRGKALAIVPRARTATWQAAGVSQQALSPRGYNHVRRLGAKVAGNLDKGRHPGRRPPFRKHRDELPMHVAVEIHVVRAHADAVDHQHGPAAHGSGMVDQAG